jgi:hypothetical protein
MTVFLLVRNAIESSSKGLSERSGVRLLQPSLPRHSRIGPLHPVQALLDDLLFLHAVDLCLHNTVRTQWWHIDLLPLLSLKKVPHRRPLTDRPAATEQTSIAAAMPEAPSEAYTLLITEHDLSADLADGEVENGSVAGAAGDSG